LFKSLKNKNSSEEVWPILLSNQKLTRKDNEECLAMVDKILIRKSAFKKGEIIQYFNL